MQLKVVHNWLSGDSYWSKGIPFHIVKTAFDNSFCIAVLLESEQVGYARLITDYITYAYLADVFILENHRGIGLGKKMVETLLGLEWMKQVRTLSLITKDAHGLYKKCGYKSLAEPERYMEIINASPWPMENINIF